MTYEYLFEACSIIVICYLNIVMQNANTVFFYRNHISGGGAEKILIDAINTFLQQNTRVVLIYRVCLNRNIFKKIININNMEFVQLDSTICYRWNSIKYIHSICKDCRTVPLISYCDYPIHHMLRDVRDLFADSRLYWIHMDTNYPVHVHDRFKPILDKYNLNVEDIYSGMDLIRLENPKFKNMYPETVRDRTVGFYNDVNIPSVNNITLTGKYNLLSVNGLRSPRKSIIPLVEQLITNKLNDYHLYIIGEVNPEMEKNLLHVQGYDTLSENVTILNEVDNIYDYYKACDYMITTAEYEGTSNAILESICMGTPVVTSLESQGTRELVEHGVNGIICNVVDDIIPTLRVYINNPVKRKALAAACKMWGADNILRSQGQMNYVRLVQDRPVSTSKKTIYFKRIQQICNGVENTLLKAPWEYDKP
jgi:glycosyltransferase involved in cell wall biosynthesis